MKLSRTLKMHRTSILFALPYLLLFAVFTVLPVVMSLILSFTRYDILNPPEFAGVSNYLRLFLEDEVFLIAVRNTLLFAIITGPVGYLACLLVAWMINEFPPKLRAVLTLIFYAPSISGAVYVVWSIIFSSDAYGIANYFLTTLGLIDEPVLWLQDPTYMLGVIILVQIWLSLGTSFLTFIAGLQGVDVSLYEAGAMDGIRNRWQELWYITLPSIRPQLMFGAVMQITAAFAASDICMNLAGFPSVDYAAHTIVIHMMDYGTTRFELGIACAIATILFLLTFGTNLLVRKLLRRVGN
jgi:ABC transporter, permease protein